MEKELIFTAAISVFICVLFLLLCLKKAKGSNNAPEKASSKTGDNSQLVSFCWSSCCGKTDITVNYEAKPYETKTRSSQNLGEGNRTSSPLLPNCPPNGNSRNSPDSETTFIDINSLNTDHSIVEGDSPQTSLQNTASVDRISTSGSHPHMLNQRSISITHNSDSEVDWNGNDNSIINHRRNALIPGDVDDVDEYLPVNIADVNHIEPVQRVIDDHGNINTHHSEKPTVIVAQPESLSLPSRNTNDSNSTGNQVLLDFDIYSATFVSKRVRDLDRDYGADVVSEAGSDQDNEDSQTQYKLREGPITHPVEDEQRLQEPQSINVHGSALIVDGNIQSSVQRNRGLFDQLEQIQFVDGYYNEELTPPSHTSHDQGSQVPTIHLSHTYCSETT